jgi:hypothetical protein
MYGNCSFEGEDECGCREQGQYQDLWVYEEEQEQEQDDSTMSRAASEIGD